MIGADCSPIRAETTSDMTQSDTHGSVTQRRGRQEQIVVVFVAHTAILAGVYFAMAAYFDTAPPDQFWAAEAGILLISAIGGCLDTRPFSNVAQAWIPRVVRSMLRNSMKLLAGTAWRIVGLLRIGRSDTSASVSRRAENFRAIILLVAFGLQFVALEGLLTSTGGPVESPFAPLAVAIAIFSPFVANNPATMFGILVTTLVFYFVMVNDYSFVGDGVDAGRPSKWAYYAINAGLLTGSVILSIFDVLNRQDQAALAAGDDGLTD